jgi:hypothetical protein
MDVPDISPVWIAFVQIQDREGAKAESDEAVPPDRRV